MVKRFLSEYFQPLVLSDQEVVLAVGMRVLKVRKVLHAAHVVAEVV
jgi:hypothetical protein